MDADFQTARFQIDQVRAGDIQPFAYGGLVDVRYGTDTKFLERGTQYVIGASVDPATNALSSKVREVEPLFAGDDVIGIAENDVNCPVLADPVRTLDTDGTSVDSSVLGPMTEAKGDILRAAAVAARRGDGDHLRPRGAAVAVHGDRQGGGIGGPHRRPDRARSARRPPAAHRAEPGSARKQVARLAFRARRRCQGRLRAHPTSPRSDGSPTCLSAGPLTHSDHAVTDCAVDSSSLIASSHRSTGSSSAGPSSRQRTTMAPEIGSSRSCRSATP